MTDRKIKDARDLKTDELIYFKGHAQSTFMSDGNSVEDIINEIKENGTGGGSDIDLSGYATKSDLDTKADKNSLADVAISGSYNDLTDKPTIPTSTVTEDTVAGWGFTKNTGTYSKPNGGIPKSDLADDIQTSLGKADSALQSYTEQYRGTVTGIKINDETINPINGIIDLGTNFKLVDNSGSDEIVIENNSAYLLTKEVGETLVINYQNNKNVIATIIFKTGETSPQISFKGRSKILWANNIIPIIEPDTAYEISLSPGYLYSSQVHVILTPFKPA